MAEAPQFQGDKTLSRAPARTKGRAVIVSAALLHAVAVVVFASSVLLLGAASLLPPAWGRWLLAACRWLGSLALASLGASLITGAWALTPLKRELGSHFFQAVAPPLVLKLALAFALANATAFLCFAACLPLARHLAANGAAKPKVPAPLGRRLRAAVALTLLLTAATVWAAYLVAVRLSAAGWPPAIPRETPVRAGAAKAGIKMVTFELLSPGKYLPADYFERLAPGCRTVEVEIGPGNGHFLLEAARSRSDTFFVGIEVRRSWADRLRERAREMPNVLVVHGDARWIVQHLFPDGVIDCYHVYFPDPWWKKRHHKRRLFTEEFCRHVFRTLRPGGRLLLVTDVEAVFRQAAERLSAAGLIERPWHRQASDEAQSAYEKKYRQQGRILHEAAFERPPAAQNASQSS